MVEEKIRRRSARMDRTTYLLFLRYLLIVLIPIFILLIMGAVSVLVNQSYVSRQISASNFKTLEQIENSVDLTFDELDSMALSFSASPEFLQSLNEIVTSPELTFEQSKVLTTIKNFVDVSAYARQYIHSIYVYVANKGNQVLTTSNGVVALGNFYDKEWYRSYLSHPQSDMFWTESRTIDEFPSVEPSQTVLTIYRRVFYLIGLKEPGVVVLNIRLSYFESLINRLKNDKAQQILVLNAQGKSIVGGADLGGTDFGSTLHLAQDSEEDQYITAVHGTRYIVNQVRSPKYGWTYVALTPVDRYYNASLTLRDINIAIVLISFLVGAMLTFYTSRRNFRHIEHVVEIVEAAERGAPLPSIPADTNAGFSHVTYSILRTFLEHEYMKVQLSERKYRQRTLELLALQSQMNPHFLFNTLETINWRVIELTKRPNQINDIIKSLSDLLKYSLQSPFKLETLENETKHAQDYVEIQRIRYKDTFTVNWDIPKNLNEYRVVRFLLQPLLENSIFHGIEKKGGKGTITVQARRTGSEIRIIVTDDGAGISPQRLRELRDSLESDEGPSDGIGLQNTNRRITLAFGERYGVTVESVEREGTTVVVLIPARL